MSDKAPIAPQNPKFASKAFRNAMINLARQNQCTISDESLAMMESVWFASIHWVFAASDSLPRGQAREDFLTLVAQEINEQMARRRQRN